MKKPQFANPQQNISATAQISNQAMLGMLNEPEGDTRFSKALRAKFETKYKPDTENGTALSSVEQANYENRFALPMDDVRVYHKSDLPSKFDAGAITYGTDIYIAPGQEELLSHEMTHVAQQKLGQVKPTDIENQLPISRESSLENNADDGLLSNVKGNGTYPVVQCCKEIDESKQPVTVPKEFLTNVKNISGHTACHGYTLGYLNKLSQDQSIGLQINDIGKAVLKAAGEASQGKFNAADIYGAAYKSGLVKKLSKTDLTKKETAAALVGQIFLMLNQIPQTGNIENGLIVPHSMVISAIDEVTGVNNSSSLGHGAKIVNENRNNESYETHEIETFSNFSKRPHHISKGRNRSKGGWIDNNKIKYLSTSGVVDTAYLPVLGDVVLPDGALDRFYELLQMER